MNLEMQVTNFSISKRLKELNLKQESYFYWCINENANNGGLPNFYSLIDSKRLQNSFYYPTDKISAFTASELADMLPHIVDTKINEPFNNFRLWISKSFIIEGMLEPKKFIYIINYKCDSTECAGENAWLSRQLTGNIHAFNLADAMALMLIYLIENKFVEIKNDLV